jgi:hypothetical protein
MGNPQQENQPGAMNVLNREEEGAVALYRLMRRLLGHLFNV